jgi:hypothetical protein
MDYTLNQLYDKLRSFFERHYFINSVTIGIQELADAEKNPIYPHAHIQVNNSGINNLIDMSFDLLIEDLPRVKDDKVSTINHIHSDIAQTFNDFVAAMYWGDEIVESSQVEFTNNPIEAFYDGQTQSTAGWVMNFTVTQQNGWNICNLPVSTVPPEPPAACLPASILDDGGNLLQSVNSGASYTLDAYRLTGTSGSFDADVSGISSGIVTGDTLQNVITGFNSAPSLSDVASDIVAGASDDLEAELSDLICTPCAVATLLDADGATLITIASGASLTIQNYRVTPSAGSGVFALPVTAISGGGGIIGASLTEVIQLSQDQPSHNYAVIAQDIVDGSDPELITELSDLICTPCPACDDGTITINSAAFGTVASGGTIDIPVEYVNGTPVGSLVGSVWTIPNPSSPSGIVYKRPVYSQYNSYNDAGTIDNAAASYDEGWHLRNGSYDYTPPAYPATFAALDFTNSNPFIVLASNNSFGNTNRFTAADGTQTYPDNYVVDNLTGLGYWADEVNGNSTWAAQLAYANAASEGGYSDWRMATNEELNMIFSENSAGFPAPFNNIGTGAIWSATTFPESLTQAYVTFATKGWTRNTKISSRSLIIVRNHFT